MGGTPDRVNPDGAGSTAGPLIALGAELDGLFDRLARRLGNVTLAQFRVLDRLAVRSPDPLEPQHLARELAMGSNHVTMLLDALERRRLLRRAPHPHDRRRRLVTATPGGLEVARVLTAHMAALESRIMDAALTPADQQRLRDLMRRVQEVVHGIVVPDVRARPGP